MLSKPAPWPGALLPECTARAIPRRLSGQRRCSHSTLGRRRVRLRWTRGGLVGVEERIGLARASKRRHQLYRAHGILQSVSFVRHMAVGDRATAWTKLWRILKAVCFETSSLVGGYYICLPEKPRKNHSSGFRSFGKDPVHPLLPPGGPAQPGPACGWWSTSSVPVPGHLTKTQLLDRPLRWHRAHHCTPCGVLAR